jgi:hypothetical protein
MGGMPAHCKEVEQNMYVILLTEEEKVNDGTTVFMCC